MAAAVSGLALASAIAIPAAQAASTDTATRTITWGSCSDPVLQQAHAQCGLLTVPLDYQHPTGPTIQLAVSRIQHTSPNSDYQGVMLVNPGGPGGPGLEMSLLGQAVPQGVGADYDWIGFDPRGVGSSKPALTCDPQYFSADRPNYVPSTPALQQTWLARARGYAQACGQAQPALLQHMTTIDSARDMDSIRAALGARQISYYGFSYGTYLGQVYGTLFPQRVRRMVLDSNADPRNVWYQANLNQDTAFNRNINIWFAWVAQNDAVYHLGTSQDAVRALYYRDLAQLATHPAGGTIGPDEWTDTFLTAAYFRFVWTDTAAAWSAWVHQGDASALIALYEQADGPGNDNAYAVYLATECTDAQWPTSWARWQRDNSRINARAPFMTWANAWFNAPCIFWPAKASTPVRVDGANVSSALLIDETLDGATPYEGSLEVRTLFPGSRLIAEPGGTTHADSLNGDACVDNQIAAYLAHGTLPPRQPGNRADTTCAPLPDPVAAGSAVSSNASIARPHSPTGTEQRAPRLNAVMYGPRVLLGRATTR